MTGERNTSTAKCGLPGTRDLPPGLIYAVAEAGGVDVKRRGSKLPIRCPLHDDRQASAFLSANNVFFCAVCTPNGGMSAKDFAAALGVDWRGIVTSLDPAPRPSTRSDSRSTFTPHDAAVVWTRACERMRDDDAVPLDREVWAFISKRGLGEGHELSAFGILGDGMSLPDAVASWPSKGYRLVAPLFDQFGSIANVQARVVRDRSPKTLFPAGSAASGTLFACARGVQVLRGEWSGPPCFVLGEGLTDHVALTIASPAPVLSAPGTSMAASGVGTWVRDAVLYVALDFDHAGNSALSAVSERAYLLGAARVRRLEWPEGAKDACDVVDRAGVAGLEAFLRRHVLEAAS